MTLTKIPLEALQKISRHKPIIKNYVHPKLSMLVIRFANDQPFMGNQLGLVMNSKDRPFIYLTCEYGCSKT